MSSRSGSHTGSRTGSRSVKKRPRSLRLLRIAARILFSFLAGVALLALGLGVALYAGGATWAVNRLLQAINPYPDAALRSARVTGNLVSSLELHDVRVTRANGEMPFRLEALRLRYDPRSLLGDDVVIREVQLVHPSLELRPASDFRHAGGRRDRARDTSTSRTRRVILQRISVVRGDARVHVGAGAHSALRIKRLDVEGHDLAIGNGIRFGPSTVRLRFLPPDESRGWATLDVQASRPAFDQAHGTPVHLDVDARFADGSRAQVRGRITQSTTASATDRTYQMHATLRRFNPTLVMLGPTRPAVVNGDVEIDLRGPRLDQLDGRVRVDLHRSAYAAFRTRRTALAATLTRGRAHVDLESETGVADISARGSLRPFDAVPSYDLAVRVRRHARETSLAWLDRLLGQPGASLSLRVQGHDLRPRRMDLVATGTLQGSPRLPDARVRVNLRDGIARLAARTTLGGGSLALNAVVDPFSPRPTLTVDRVQFHHLDLAGLVPRAGITSDLSGTGRVRVYSRPRRGVQLSGRLALAPSRVGAATLTRGDIAATLAQGNVDFRMTLSAPAGTLAAAGAVRPFDRIPSYLLRHATFQAVDLARLLRSERLHTSLAGSLRAEGRGFNPRTAQIRGTIVFAPSVVQRRTIRTGRLHAALAAGRLDLVGTIVGQDNSATIAGSIEPFTGRPRVHLTGDLDLRDLASLLKRDSLDAGGIVRLAVDGELGGRDSTQLRGELHAAGHVASVAIDTVQATLRLVGDVLTVDTVSLHSNIGHAAGAGAFVLFGPRTAKRSDFRLDGHLADLTPLAPLLGTTNLGLDSARIQVAAAGPSDRVHVQLDLQAAGLAIGPRRAQAVHASVAGELSANRAPIAGTADLLLEGLVIHDQLVRTVRLQAGYRNRELALRGESAIDRARGARVVARIYPDASERQLRLDTLEAQTTEGHWALRHPVAITYGERIHVDDFILAAGRHRIAVDGIIDRRGQQQLSARVDSLRVGWLATVLGIGAGLNKSDWEVDGTLRLTGPAAAPRATGELAIAPHPQHEATSTVRGRFDWAGARGLNFELGIASSKGDSLRLTGRVPLALSLAVDTGASGSGLVTRIPRGELALDATADKFRIETFPLLLPPGIARALRGRLDVNARARGSLEAPEVGGEFALTDAEVRVPGLGVTYDEGEVRITLRGREFQVTRAQLASGEGRLDAHGVIRLQPSGPPTLDLQSTLRDFRVAAADNLRSTVSGTAHLGGTTAAPVLEGSVRLQQSDLYLQMKNPARAAEPVELTPADLRLLEERFGYTITQSPAQRRGAFAPWTFDVEVALGESNWLRRRTDPIVAVELSGKVEARKAPGESVQLFGTITPVPGRSFVQIVGRRFEVVNGMADLSGPLKNARMRFRGEYRVDAIGSTSSSATPTVLITAQVNVDTGRFDVTLGAIPPMENSDIKSYLATGRPASTDPTQTNDDASVLTAGATLAAGTVLGKVAGGAGQKLGLDVVQILQDREGTQTLAAGKYVSPPLYLGFRQPIIAVQNGRPEASKETLEIEVEYAALRRALLNVQGAGSELRVFMRRRR